MKKFILLISILFTSNAFSFEIEDVYTGQELSTKELIVNNTPKEILKKAEPFIDIIIKISKDLDVDPVLVFSMAWTETHFRIRDSHAGAKGLLQIMPSTHRFLENKHKNELRRFTTYYITDYSKVGKFNFDNIVLGVFYIKYLLNKFNDKKLAILAYNMGPTRVAINIKRNIPQGENHQYVRKVKEKIFLITKKS